MKTLSNILVILFTFTIVSCGAHFPRDIAPNPASLNYHQIEFDIIKEGDSKKEWGIANLYVNENTDYDSIEIHIHGIKSGTLSVFSNACNVDQSIPFDGITKFSLSDIATFGQKCSIRFTSVTDQIEGNQHVIVESGILKLNFINSNNHPSEISYTRNNRLYSFKGQGSLQRVEGPLGLNETVTINTHAKEGGIYRVVGCGNSIEGSFEKSSFDINLRNLYSKDFLDTDDTCDLEINAIPFDQTFSSVSRVSLSIYSNSVVKLEPLSWNIERRLRRMFIRATGNEYVVACSINDSYEFKRSRNRDVECRERYSSNTTYWLRSVTTNGRKSVVGVRNGKVVWEP